MLKPTSQADPQNPLLTPTGLLVGSANFYWSGSAWVAASAGGSLTTVANAAVTAVPSTTASQQALAANPDRRGLIANNTDAYACLLKYGTGASASSYTYRIPPGVPLEIPQPAYTGVIEVIWEGNGTGSLILTETY